MTFVFQKLLVYQKSVDLAADAYSATEQFQRDCGFLVAQLNRAAPSISRMVKKLEGRFFVARRSLPGVDVDEVVQRTFVEAFQGIGQFKAGTNLQAWLLSIARYQLMMEATRLRRLAEPSLKE